jgi:preprotein translocase subunit SecF
VVIKGFVFALLIGIFVGTYSSVFVAAPVLLISFVRRKAQGKENAEEIKFNYCY